LRGQKVWGFVRISVSHNKSKDEARKAVDRSFDDFFRGIAIVPLQIINEQRIWEGSTLKFSFQAKAGLLASRIEGMIEVTENDVIIDADFGILELLLGGKRAGNVLETKVRGLLN
jgi:Putative polyhydroxyalkanoic acid system protein (PHA_gran_rgn)